MDTTYHHLHASRYCVFASFIRCVLVCFAACRACVRNTLNYRWAEYASNSYNSRSSSVNAAGTAVVGALAAAGIVIAAGGGGSPTPRSPQVSFFIGTPPLLSSSLYHHNHPYSPHYYMSLSAPASMSPLRLHHNLNNAPPSSLKHHEYNTTTRSLSPQQQQHIHRSPKKHHHHHHHNHPCGGGDGGRTRHHSASYYQSISRSTPPPPLQPSVTADTTACRKVSTTTKKDPTLLDEAQSVVVTALAGLSTSPPASASCRRFSTSAKKEHRECIFENIDLTTSTLSSEAKTDVTLVTNGSSMEDGVTQDGIVKHSARDNNLQNIHGNSLDRNEDKIDSLSSSQDEVSGENATNSRNGIFKSDLPVEDKKQITQASKRKESFTNKTENKVWEALDFPESGRLMRTDTVIEQQVDPVPTKQMETCFTSSTKIATAETSSNSTDDELSSTTIPPLTTTATITISDPLTAERSKELSTSTATNQVQTTAAISNVSRRRFSDCEPEHRKGGSLGTRAKMYFQLLNIANNPRKRCSGMGLNEVIYV